MSKALVVDDSRLARVTLTRMLEKRGFEVTGVESGAEALAHLQSAPADVVFMDFMMPEMSGYEATRALRDNPQTGHIPVVMCTSQDTPEDRAEAQRNGARGFITKPASDSQLDQVLELLRAAPAPAPAGEVTEAVEAAVTARQGDLEEAVIARLEQRLAERAPVDAAQLREMVAAQLKERLATERGTIMEALLADPRLASMVEWNIAALPKAATVQEMVNAPALLETIDRHLESRLDRERTVIPELLLNSQRLSDLVDSRIPAIPEPVTKAQIIEDPSLHETIAKRVSEEAIRTRSALFVDLPADPRFAELVKASMPKSDTERALHRLETEAKRLRRLAMLTAVLALSTAAMALLGTFVY